MEHVPALMGKPAATTEKEADAATGLAAIMTDQAARVTCYIYESRMRT